MVEFSEPRVCTITATVSLGTRVNIIDTAKHAKLSDAILAVRITYAGGRSSICKGVPAKASRAAGAKRSFNNQVTFIVSLISGDGHACCKVFHNGTIHITGARSHEDLEHAVTTIWQELQSIGGNEITPMDPDAMRDRGLFLGRDHVMYACDGSLIGWGDWNANQFYLNDVGFVEIIKSPKMSDWSFACTEWRSGIKPIYNMSGKRIGQRVMAFFPGAGRRYYNVQGNDIFIGSVRVGVVDEELTPLPDAEPDAAEPDAAEPDAAEPDAAEPDAEWGLQDPAPDRRYSAVENKDAKVTPFSIHMVNMYFKCSTPINRVRLHNAFLADGYYSRFDPCVNPGVNLRFYDNENQKKYGVCECVKHCSCKRVSLRCFTSGSLIVAGLRDIDHGTQIHRFISDYYHLNFARIK